MNRTQTGLAVVAFCIALLMPAGANHITGQGPTPSGLTSGDWFIGAPNNIVICESNGPSDDLNDNPTPLAGQNGLCYSGTNAVTGVAGPAAMPSVDEVIRFDLCRATVATRDSSAVGTTGDNNGVIDPGETCADGGDQNTDLVYYTFSLGVFTCDIPHSLTPGRGTAGGPHPGWADGSTDDGAAFYRNLYAWWSFDAYDGNFGGERNGAVGDGHYTDPDDGMDGPDDNEFPDAGVYKDSADAHRGHVAAFIDVSLNDPAAPTQGSAETKAFTDDPKNDTDWGYNFLTDDADYDAAGNANATTNSCGGSPACPPTKAGSDGMAGTFLAGDGSSTTCTDPYGPVWRQPYGRVP